MTHENVEPRIDKMIAALYGELSESEERAFRRLLEKDAALRAEWEELSGSRRLLAGWSVEERVPSFVLVEGERQAPPAAAASGGGLLARIGDLIKSLGPGPVWGLATATAAFVAFVLADMRFQDRLERELAARDAAVAPAPAATTHDPFAGLGAGRSIEPVKDKGEIVRVSSDTYLTPTDLQNYNSELMTVLVDLLNQYDSRRAEEVNGLVQALYERVNRQQVFDNRQLNNRIDAVGAELILEKDRHERALDQLIGPARKAETPASGSEK